MSNPENQFPIQEHFQQAVKEHGWTICGVFDNENKTPNFIYTINATEHLGVELIVVGNLQLNALHGLFNAVANHNKFEPGEFTIEGFNIDLNGVPTDINLALLDVSGEPWLDETFTNRCDSFNKVYQILYGDKTNVLPTVVGNTDPFKQLAFHTKKC